MLVLKISLSCSHTKNRCMHGNSFELGVSQVHRCQISSCCPIRPWLKHLSSAASLNSWTYCQDGILLRWFIACVAYLVIVNNTSTIAWVWLAKCCSIIKYDYYEANSIDFRVHNHHYWSHRLSCFVCESWFVCVCVYVCVRVCMCVHAVCLYVHALDPWGKSVWCIISTCTCTLCWPCSKSNSDHRSNM